MRTPRLSSTSTRSRFPRSTGLAAPASAATTYGPYLEPRIGGPLALIGEAPSAHGARFSGIAFTAERSLPPDRRTSAPGLRAGGFTEHSATILGRALIQVGIDPSDVVLWNVVPFHPARVDDPLRNRTPTAGELELGARWLARFRALMRPALVVAVGQTASRALPAGTRVVRHPANGGSPQMRLDLASLIAVLDDLPRSAP